MKHLHKVILLYLIAYSFTHIHAQPVGFKWGGFKFTTSPGGEFGQKIQTDANGNIYTGGDCSIPFVIDSDTLHANGYTSNQFILKHNRVGQKQWLKRLSSVNFSRIMAIEVDAQENVYITGSFRDSLRVENFVLSSANSSQPGFVLKLNKQGIVQWLIRIGNGATSNSVAANIASNGNLIIAGNFFGLTNRFGSFNLTTLSNTTHLYVASISPQGAINWVTYSKGNYNELFDLALDKNDNVFVCGTHNSNITLNGQNYIIPYQNSGYDGYLIKLDNNGTLVWARGMGSGSTDMAKKLATDNSGNCYVYGYWGQGGSQHQIVFDSTNIVSKTPGKSYSFFLAKYDANGSVAWAQKFDEFNGSGDLPHLIATDTDGNCYLSGHFTGIWFGQNIQDTILYSGLPTVYEEIAIQQFLPDGQRGWNVVAGNNMYGTYERVEDLVIDKQGNFCIVGIHGGYDSLRIGDTVVSNATLTNVFLAKYGFGKQRVELNPLNSTQTCAGDTALFPFSVNDTIFSRSNTFTLQLSNSLGLFNAPINLVSLTANTSDTFKFAFPASFAQGTGYRLRIVASNPQFVSYDNGQDFTIHSLPAVPTISLNDTILTCVQPSAAYQWYVNDTPIVNATSKSLALSRNGSYKVKVTNSNGCSRYSDTLTYVKSIPMGLENAQEFKPFLCYPNPATTKLYIQSTRKISPGLYDLLGKRVLIHLTETTDGFIADLNELKDGIYIVKIHVNGKDWMEKIVLVK
jgi:hypothetical protein